MYINTDKRLAFIAHPRTASNSIRVALERRGFHNVVSHHHCAEAPDDWTVFAVVRDPFDLMVSWYYLEISKTKRPIPFPDWLRERMAHPNEYMQRGLFFGLEFCTDILHYENLQEEFDQLMTQVGLPRIHLPMRNVSMDRVGKKFVDYYTPELIDLVVGRFGGAIFGNGYKVPT